MDLGLLPHLPYIEVNPLPCHPPFPMLICFPIYFSLSVRPVCHPFRTGTWQYLRHAMPCIASRPRHNKCISRSQADSKTFATFQTRHENSIAAQRNADQWSIALFAHIPMQTQRITGCVEVDYGGLCFHSWKQSFHQCSNIFRKRWRW